MMGKITKFVTSRPLGVVLVLALMVIIVGCIPVTIWRKTTEDITNDVASSTQDLRSSLVSEIENIGHFIYPKANPSTVGLVNVIESHLTDNITHFTVIQTQIAPVLFQAFVTTPQVSQVSYISTDGMLFSYMTELNTSVAVFANSSLSTSGENYTWYIQAVDNLTGELKGGASRTQALDLTHTNWFQEANQNHTTSFIGAGLRGEDNETLLQSVGSLSSKKGVVSLGFPIKTLTDVLNGLNLHGGEYYLWTKEGMLLVREGSLNASSFIINGSICFGQESRPARSQCILQNCGGCKVEIGRSKFQAYSSVLEVSGVSLRYALMFPNKRGGTSIKNGAMYLLIATMVLCVLYSLGFVASMVNAARRERDMRATLINQMEATQQAERKSMNKSRAFASASHDIRGALAGISGLVDLCRQEVPPGSELDTNLKQVNVCAAELLELLNSVLDMSKIESGKMQLEEEDFNLTNLLEDVVDFYHPVAMKKEIDVVLDLQDGSIFKHSNVRGDSAKLKQILNNLVSNAVKFTVEGHISIRAWAQRPGSKSSVAMVSEPEGGGSVISKISKYMLGKENEKSSNYEAEISNSIRNNANTMEFVFEVDDTGKGVPMEMRKSVFENYVQVRETARGQQGTGLGLGIVQSLVRLMGGEIRIVDKAMGEKGTCFQFNVLLPISEAPTSEVRMGQDMEAGGDCVSTPNLGLTINTSVGSSMNIRNLSPRFNNCLISSPKLVGSRVVLLLKDEERRRVTDKYIKSLGIKVTVVEKWEHLSPALEKLSGFSPMGGGESSIVSSPSAREAPLIGGTDGNRKRSNSFHSFVLVVIDAKAGPLLELQDIVEQFRIGLQQNITCKVVWLNDVSAHGSDISYLKPLHGSRLNQVLKMLPEFGGGDGETSPKNTSSEIQEEGSYNKRIGKAIMAPLERETYANSVRTTRSPIATTPKGEEKSSKAKEDGILKGKKVLVVDDNPITSKIAARKLMMMGCEVTECDSGKEAVRLVNEWLTQRDDKPLLPFDYIFMDCQMPEMDGYEATREIRKAERQYGVHIPIIAVSGHDRGSKEAKDAIEAGMDEYLEKNMNLERLGNIIREIESKMSLT